MKDGCFLTYHGVVLVKEYLGGGKYSCFYYRKKDLDTYFDIFLNSKSIDIYFLRNNLKSIVCTKDIKTLVIKCACLPVDKGFVILRLLHNKC